MFVRVWQYRAEPGSEREFEEMYGPAGAWVRLFQVAAGYLGTELRRAPDPSGDYQTVDRWNSRASWEAFRQRHGAAYESLDRRCELLIERETFVGEYVASESYEPDRTASMRVTVCELNDRPDALTGDWERLVAYVRSQQSELVLLPEMPFYPWFAVSPVFEPHIWQAAVAAHDAWQERFAELAPAIVLGTRPVNRGGQRLNEGFCWTQEAGYRIAHHKYYLPEEAGFWEASWYSRGDGSFTSLPCGSARVGFAICTELWAFDHARLYGRESVHIIVTPRATAQATLDKWVVGGRATAITSGAFSLSSNHVSSAADAVHLGGQGWVIAPDGEVLALTSQEQPFVTVDLDLGAAERAKLTYPRYVF